VQREGAGGGMGEGGRGGMGVGGRRVRRGEEGISRVEWGGGNEEKKGIEERRKGETKGAKCLGEGGSGKVDDGGGRGGRRSAG